MYKKISVDETLKNKILNFFKVEAQSLLNPQSLALSLERRAKNYGIPEGIFWDEYYPILKEDFIKILQDMGRTNDQIQTILNEFENVRKYGSLKERRLAMFRKKAWEIERGRLPEEEHERRLQKLREYERKHKRTLSQDEAERMYYLLGRTDFSGKLGTHRRATIEVVAKSPQKSKRYQNPDGSFKEMTCPDDPSRKSKFCGCVRYFMSEEGGNLSLERAKKMCGYIKRRKYGEFNRISRRFGRPRTDEERLRRHRRLHPEDEVKTIEDLPPRGTGLRKADKNSFRYLVMYFDDKEGNWNEITRDEMLKALSDNYDNAEELINMLEKGELPTVTTSFAAYKVQPITKKISKRYHPPSTEELKPEPKRQVDTFLEWAGYPKKGSDVTDLLTDYFWEYAVVKENRNAMIRELRRRGYKVRPEDIDTTVR